MVKKATKPGGIFKRTDIKISVLISFSLVIIMLISGFFLSSMNDQAISDAMYKKGKMISILGAKSLEITLEAAIGNNLLTQDEIFDSQYVPVAGSDLQLFHTKFDAYIDEACSQFHGAFFKDNSIVYARPMDLNGYIPLKGGGDLADSNTAQNTEDPLGKQILAGKRISRIVANTVDGFVQDYTTEDSNVHIWEFSTPVFVKGKKWGSFTVGMRNMAQNVSGTGFSITALLSVVLSILLACAVVFGVVLYFLKPVSGLAKAAEKVADGDMDFSVEIGGSSDIAMLADAIERLRVSLKLSMEMHARK